MSDFSHIVIKLNEDMRNIMLTGIKSWKAQVKMLGIFSEVFTFTGGKQLKGPILHIRPWRKTCNPKLLEQHLLQCRVSFFGYSILLDLVVIPV